MFRYLKNENISEKLSKQPKSAESTNFFFDINSNNLNNRLKSDRRGLLIQGDNHSQGQVVFRRSPRVEQHFEKPKLRK